MFQKINIKFTIEDKLNIDPTTKKTREKEISRSPPKVGQRTK